MTAALWYWDSEFIRIYLLLFLCLLCLLCLLHLLCFCNCYDCFSVCSEICTLSFSLSLFFSDLVMTASAAVITSIILIDIQIKMFETHICALTIWDDCRALNTLRNYKRLIEKWKICFSLFSSSLFYFIRVWSSADLFYQIWCHKKKFSDSIIIYKKKVILFLFFKVIWQSLQSHSKSKWKLLKYDSVQTKYLTVIIYMYKKQCFSEFNYHYHSTQTVLKTLLKSLKWEQISVHQKIFEDCALNSLLNFYDMKSMRKIVTTMWSQIFISEQYLWTTVNFLISHMLLLWDESMCNAELPDLFVINFDNESSQCKTLILIKNNEKINQHKKVKHCAVIQSKNFLFCFMSALIFYFFWRWHCTDKLFSTFRAYYHWYWICLIIEKCKKLIKILNYNTQLNWIKQTYNETHMQIFKSIYNNQSDEAHHAERADVKNSQICLCLSISTVFQFEMLFFSVYLSFPIICFTFTSEFWFWKPVLLFCTVFPAWRPELITSVSIKNWNSAWLSSYSQIFYNHMSSHAGQSSGINRAKLPVQHWHRCQSLSLPLNRSTLAILLCCAQDFAWSESLYDHKRSVNMGWVRQGFNFCKPSTFLKNQGFSSVAQISLFLHTVSHLSIQWNWALNFICFRFKFC